MSRAGVNAVLGRDLVAAGAFVNRSGTGNRYAYIDLEGDNTYTDYGLRFIRDTSGPDTSSYVAHNGTGEFRFELPSGNGLRLHTSNTERVRLDITGNILLSAATSGLVGATQPAFCATYSGTTAATASNYIRFETAVFNYGSHYNTTNGLFTAPIAGRYFFRFHLLPSFTNTDFASFQVYKNGASTAGAGSAVQHPASTWNTAYCNVIFDMAANDTAGVNAGNLPAALHTDPLFDSFSGYLMV